MSVVRNKSNRMMVAQASRGLFPRQPASPVLVAGASIAILVLLGGCTSPENYDHYAIFDREPELADAPPPELADPQLSSVDVDSFRFATEYEGDRLYLARGSDRVGGICLLVHGPGDAGVTAACSGGSWVDMRRAGANAYHVHSDAALPPPGYKDITENISVGTDRG